MSSSTPPDSGSGGGSIDVSLAGDGGSSVATGLYSAGNQAAQQIGGAIGGTAGGVVGKAAQMGLGAAMSSLFGGRRDPSVQFAYMVEIDGLSLGMFSEASGIKWSMETEPVKEGGMNNHEQNLLGRAKFDPLVLKRGFVGQDGLLYDMMQQTFDPNTPVLRKIVHVVILKRSTGGGLGGLLGANEIGRLSFYKCFVQEWAGPSFNTKTNDIAVESITFKYDWLALHPGGPLEQLLHSGMQGGMSALGGSMGI